MNEVQGLKEKKISKKRKIFEKINYLNMIIFINLTIHVVSRGISRQIDLQNSIIYL